MSNKKNEAPIPELVGVEIDLLSIKLKENSLVLLLHKIIEHSPMLRKKVAEILMAVQAEISKDNPDEKNQVVIEFEKK